MRKSLGSKRKEMGDDDIATLTRLFGGFHTAQLARSFDAAGKELAKTVVLNGDCPPEPPPGGRIKTAPL